jgi:hypothetical protein
MRPKSFQQYLTGINTARYPHSMTESPVTASSDAASKNHPTGENSPSAVHSPRGSDTLRWLTYAALAIAVVASVLAALAYFHPAHNHASVPQQSGDAKANICSSYQAAHKSVVANTHMQSNNPNDAVAELAVATNARLALIGSGAYLRDRLDANTAAPTDLANAVNLFANTIEQLGINYLSNAGADVQGSLRHDLDSQISQLDKLCA